MSDLTLQQLVMRLCAFVLITGCHGVAVAGTALALGDPGPRHDGRFTLNPLAHIDLLGLASGVLFSVGWIKPVAVDRERLRGGFVGLVAVVAAVALAVLGLVLALHLCRPLLLPLLGDTASTLTFALIEIIAQSGLWFALVNLVPLPPFTGGLLLTPWLPPSERSAKHLHIWSGVAAAVIAATGVITSALAPLYRMTAQLILGD